MRSTPWGAIDVSTATIATNLGWLRRYRRRLGVRAKARQVYCGRVVKATAVQQGETA